MNPDLIIKSKDIHVYTATGSLTLVLEQSGNTVTGLITSPDGTLDLTGYIVNSTLAVNFTMPCNNGNDPGTASMTFTVPGTTLTAESASKLACNKDIAGITGTLTMQ